MASDGLASKQQSDGAQCKWRVMVRRASSRVTAQNRVSA